MKTIILTILCSIFAFNYSIGQKISEIYKFKVPVDYNNIQYKEDHKVKIVDTTNTDTIHFVYLKFKKGIHSKSLNEKYYFKENEITAKRKGDQNSSNFDQKDLKIHKMSRSIFKKVTSQYHYYHRFKGVKAGLFTVPFKLRINDFDFEQNVNLGMSVSFRFRMNRKVENDWLLSPTLGIGLSTVKLNPKNSNISEDSENANRTASAFSLSSGIVIELKESINLSIQYGFDFLGNDDKNVNWKYDRKSWIGLGINIGFPISENETENENTEN